MPDVATLNALTAGLFAQAQAGLPVPLTGVSVEGTITGLCGRVSVAHRYRNAESTPIEAVYLFPLDEGAAVCGFEAIIDGAVVVAEVQERDKAFEHYDEAIGQGHGAYLLDEERPDVFRASIGNLPPGKEVLVRITYVTELPVDGGRVRFTLPTTIAPKYAPAEDQRGVGRPEAEAVNPPLAWQVVLATERLYLHVERGRARSTWCPEGLLQGKLGSSTLWIRSARSPVGLARLAVRLPR